MTPEAPERIHGWQHNQMSIARHYGGLRYMGHEYTIAYAEPGTPLVRWDVIKAEAKAKKQAAKEAGDSYTNRRELTGKNGAPLPPAAPAVVLYQLPDNGRG